MYHWLSVSSKIPPADGEHHLFGNTLILKKYLFCGFCATLSCVSYRTMQMKAFHKRLPKDFPWPLVGILFYFENTYQGFNFTSWISKKLSLWTEKSTKWGNPSNLFILLLTSHGWHSACILLYFPFPTLRCHVLHFSQDHCRIKKYLLHRCTSCTKAPQLTNPEVLWHHQMVSIFRDKIFSNLMIVMSPLVQISNDKLITDENLS